MGCVMIQLRQPCDYPALKLPLNREGALSQIKVHPALGQQQLIQFRSGQLTQDVLVHRLASFQVPPGGVAALPLVDAVSATSIQTPNQEPAPI